MATTHTVVKGDTLWKIAEKYLGSGTKYKQLAAINNISNPDKLYIGQVIKLSKDSSGSGSSTSSKPKTNSNKVTITAFGLQSDANNTLFATWDWDKSKETESYKVVWCYATGVGVAFVGSEKNISVDQKLPSASRQDTYSIPANATRVSFKVLPISKTKKVDKKETTYWTAQWSTTKYFDTDDLPPVAPSSAPAIEIEDYTLTVSYENIVADDLRATGVQFQIIRDNSSAVYKTVKVPIDKTLNMASYTKTVGAGHEYKVRARTYRGNKYSEWTGYSSAATTIPSTPKQITKIRANSETSVYLEWSKVASAKTYDIEYATNKKHFDISDATTTVTGIETTKYEKTGLESGEKYFFRVRAVNESGESGWSGIKSVIIGTKPAAPTTWSSSNTVMTGKNLILYWIHNSEDGSNETTSEIELYIDGVKSTKTVENPNVNKDEDEQTTRSYTIKTSTYKEGCVIKWRVRTAGITGAYGPWSIQRKVNVYAPPTLDLSVTDSNANVLGTIEKFPFYIRGVAGPDSQNPIGYHVSITAGGSYRSTDNVGNSVYINAGQEIYSKYFNTKEDLLIKMSANNINLENNISYAVKCTVTMDSGLTHEEATYFDVEWEDQKYEPNADIGVDPETLEAIISPHCRTYTYTNYLVTYDPDSDKYTRTATTLGNVYGDIISGVKTTNGDDVYSGMDEDGEDIFYTIVEKVTRVTGVKLSVYRREFDGTFTEIGTGIKNKKGTYVTDPHPSLDYARYRVVVTVTETGAISYYDVPGYPVNEPSVVIQWDEKWSNFETDTEDELEQPPWTGSMIKIPYNIDISDKHQSDVSLVEYIGRSHPVSYYGTQVGQTSSWSMEIPKDDKETLYALRRLAIWMGDVYVREPSGSGYWANISVSFNQSHCEVTIPVSLEVTRVEGGM